MLVSIIIPTVRPEQAKKCAEIINKTTGLEKDQYEILIEEDVNKIGCPIMVKNMVPKTRADMVCFLGDDTIPQKDFLKIAIEEMKYFPDGWGLIGLADGTGRELPCHWLAHKKLLPYLNGEFFHTGYKHCYADNDLKDQCIKIARYKQSKKALVKHDHPAFKNEKYTGDYARIYSPEYLMHDSALYKKRRKEFQL